MSEPQEITKSDEESNQKTDNDEIPIVIEEDRHLIRECDLYWEEYKECTGIRGRFHQYFIFGEMLNCNQWKKDYNNCCKWEESNDVKAGEALIRSERERRLNRLRAHYRNNTWKKRDAPPENWTAPLPEWMSKRDENTYLAQKAKEMRDGVEETSTSSCSIM